MGMENRTAETKHKHNNLAEARDKDSDYFHVPNMTKYSSMREFYKADAQRKVADIKVDIESIVKRIETLTQPKNAENSTDELLDTDIKGAVDAEVANKTNNSKLNSTMKALYSTSEQDILKEKMATINAELKATPTANATSK